MAAVSPSFGSKEMDQIDAPYRTNAAQNVSLPPPSPRLSPGPMPLPSFVFPARGSSSPSMTISSAPSSFSRSTGRRPASAIILPSESPLDSDNPRASLPAFSFGSLGSPPLSPRTDPPRPGTAHQRNVSEFIGGDGKTGAAAGIMSTSPTKSEGALPPPGRRGHAHRRSAAISVSDLGFILKPAPTARGGSAPTSPAAHQQTHPPLSLPGPPDSALPSPSATDAMSSAESSPPLRTMKNTRVGFSDDLEFIPGRPLSMVSSDSASTVRPGHSLSNSISSIVSAGTSSPLPKEPRSAAPPSHRMSDPRPRTADQILDRDSSRTSELLPRRRGSLPLLADAISASTSNPSTPRSAKKWSFFGHEPVSGDSSPKSRPTSSTSSAKESKKIETAPSSPDVSMHNVPMPTTERTNSRRSSISRKPSKQKKKVRSWAGSILSRKSSRRSKPKLSRRSPTPPSLPSYPSMDESTRHDFGQGASQSPPRPELQTEIASWKPRKLPPQEEAMSPIIDLDAALGPFNTPSGFGEDWDVSQQGGKRKRAMHSAAGLGGFMGPGMHYHRRAESAPEFENPRFGLHRLGSSSTMGMEDVFEEDEDEDWEDTRNSDKASSHKTGEDDTDTSLGIDIKVVDSEGMDADKPMDFNKAIFQKGVKTKGTGSSDGEPRHMNSSKSIHSTTSLVDDPIQEEAISPVEIVDDSGPSRPDSRAQSSDSTATPPFRPRQGKELAPVDVQPFALQPPYFTPSSPRSTTQSSLPSPRSPFSYDTQRISTAPSSVADENALQSLLMGEPGPELRRSIDMRESVDDVPSLTSSNSTTTREAVNLMGHPGAGNPQFRDAQRSASLSSPVVTRKRGSMASLSRLISSSHGEKSKLSTEFRPPTAQTMIEGEEKKKESKGKRISRMMQFWKPSNKDPSN